MTNHLTYYRGKRVAVTGGLGFIGSTLARTLVQLGAHVTVFDSMGPEMGGNLFNLAGVMDSLQIVQADLCDHEATRGLVPDQDVIFNLAGQVSHLESMEKPLADLDANCRGHLALLDVCRRHNPSVKIVYASTRQIYGRPLALPVTEEHPLLPIDVNGINKLAGESYHLLYHEAYGLRTCALRLTNTYGPRQLLAHSRQGFLPWLVRLALEGTEIAIFGDGKQLRDVTYVDDVVDAFLRCGARDEADGQVFNLGGVEPVSLRRIVDVLLKVVGSGSYHLEPFPPDRRRIDIGSFYADYSKITRAVGWRPIVPLEIGLRRMVEYYRLHSSHYFRTGVPV